MGIGFFRNEFYDLTEFLPSSALPLLGFPQDVVNAVAASGPGGAAVNSSSYRAHGAKYRSKLIQGTGSVSAGITHMWMR